MLAIGRALMANPRVLLMDEPSEGLAPQIVADVMADHPPGSRTSGLSIVLVEQNIKLDARPRRRHRHPQLGRRGVRRRPPRELKMDDAIVAPASGGALMTSTLAPRGRRASGIAGGDVQNVVPIAGFAIGRINHAPRRLGRGRRSQRRNTGAVEQVRADGGAQAWATRPRDPAEEHHHRHPLPRRRCRAAAEFVKPHLALDAMPLVTFRRRGDAGRSTRSRRPTSSRARGLEQAARRPRRHGPRHAGDPAAAAAVLLRRAARHRREGGAASSTTASPSSSRSKPDRLKGFGTVPMPDGNEAAKELERCVTKLGFKGVRDPDQRQRPRALRSGLRAVLEEGRGARRARGASIPTASPKPRASRASTSTT